MTRTSAILLPGRARLLPGRARLLPSLVVANLTHFALAYFANSARAADLGPAPRCCDARRCCTCPDDYCPKPLPCVPCAPRGCCDDYCAKPLPCVPCALRGCCDDYCPKPCCIYLPPCWPAWYSCGAPRALLSRLRAHSDLQLSVLLADNRDKSHGRSSFIAFCPGGVFPPDSQPVQRQRLASTATNGELDRSGQLPSVLSPATTKFAAKSRPNGAPPRTISDSQLSGIVRWNRERAEAKLRSSPSTARTAIAGYELTANS